MHCTNGIVAQLKPPNHANAPSTSTNQSAQTLDENERESGSDIYEVNDE